MAASSVSGLVLPVAKVIMATTKHLAFGRRTATLSAAWEIKAMPSFGEASGVFLEGSGVLVQVGRQWAWQNPEVMVIEFIVQLIVGLWHFSHGFPTIKFYPASLVTWKVRVSRY